jgi:hypothetical protein
MVVHDFDVLRTVGLGRPLETKPPLAVDPDTVRASSIAREGF